MPVSDQLGIGSENSGHEGLGEIACSPEPTAHVRSMLRLFTGAAAGEGGGGRRRGQNF